MTSGEKLGKDPAYYVWEAPTDVLSIHLSLKVVADLTREHLRAIARDLPWEFRGVLLGHSVSGPHPTTYVEDFALIPASAHDKNVATASDDDLAEIVCRLHQGLDHGRNAVGFFRSQRDSNLIPSTRDLKIVNRLFPAPDDVMMLIQFAPCGESQGAFFYREKGKLKRPDRSYGFPFDVAQLSRRKSSRTSIDRLVHEWPRVAPDLKFVPESRGRIRWWQLLPTAALFTLGTIAAQTGFELHTAAAPTVQASSTVASQSVLGLKVTSLPHQLQIRWNRDSSTIRAADSAELRISEGDVVVTEVVPISKRQLSDGYVAYTPMTNDVSIEFNVRAADGSVTTESMRAVAMPGNQ